jgi:hypothetical protein
MMLLAELLLIAPADLFGVCKMRSSRLRFRIGTMMTAVAVVALLLWLVVGLGRGPAGLIGDSPFYLVLATPILFASTVTLMVTLVQSLRSVK